MTWLYLLHLGLFDIDFIYDIRNHPFAHLHLTQFFFFFHKTEHWHMRYSAFLNSVENIQRVLGGILFYHFINGFSVVDKIFVFLIVCKISTFTPHPFHFLTQIPTCWTKFTDFLNWPFYSNFTRFRALMHQNWQS